MCKFCSPDREIVTDEYDEMDMRIVKLTPMPEINLTTGETATKADTPYYCLFLYYDIDKGETASFPIKYCPLCGRRLTE